MKCLAIEFTVHKLDCLLTIPNFDTTTACVAVMLSWDVCHIVVSSNQPLSQASAQVSARLLQFGREAIYTESGGSWAGGWE